MGRLRRAALDGVHQLVGIGDAPQAVAGRESGKRQVEELRVPVLKTVEVRIEDIVHQHISGTHAIASPAAAFFIAAR
jgi:hypothetical protein